MPTNERSEVVFKKSTDKADIGLFLEVFLTYSPSERELNEASALLESELAELGTNRLAFIAFESAAPIAVVQLLLANADGDPELADGHSVAHVHHLRVSWQRKKQGMGRAMMRQVETEAREMGFRRITLGVDGDNVDAIRFYEHIGYDILKQCRGRAPDEVLYYFKKDLA
ncbi:MAG: GNAT family N-acetyltransferase [Candidatus Schekmanbacteria bacterium]|nr:GNAT family N-acetyltransferase [Candidatus Schekmanbacteria bacterium]